VNSDSHIIKRLYLPGSARQLAVIRIAIGLQIYLATSSMIFPLLHTTQFCRSFKTYVPNIIGQWVAEGGYAYLVTTNQVLACLLITGLCTKFILPALLLAFLVLYSFYYSCLGYPCQWVYLWFPLLILGLSRCNDVWSIDAFILKRRAKTPHLPFKENDTTHYRWPIELLIVWFVYIYFAAGLAKLFPISNGLLWLEGGQIKDIMVTRFLESPLHYIFNEPLFNYAEEYWFYRISAFLGLFTELFVISTLFSTRFYIPVLFLVFGMHVFLFMIGIAGFIQTCIILALAFIPAHIFGDTRLVIKD
jgi:hypothetical protein